MTTALDHVGKAKLTLSWRVRKQVMFLYEIDSDAIAAHVPPSLEAMEVRPGVSLIAIECLHYYSDHFREGYREFLEMVLTVAVQPDLSIDMPVPRFCMHAISVISDSPEFVEQEGHLLYTPTELVPGLRMEFSEDGGGVDIYDGTTPMVMCRNTHPNPPYDHKVLWGQYYTNTNGLQQGIWRWEGQMFEHMKAGDWGSFHPHPVFKGIDLSRIRGCYRQMMAKPETVTDVRFYHLGLVSDRAGSRRGE
ncbi:MAG: hypothetical protein JWP01_395 [Myxococcales bacterium]|nr:hypothetical protein [Myxococcales bacterium]